jgi:hypothetical protein
VFSTDDVARLIVERLGHLPEARGGA